MHTHDQKAWLKWLLIPALLLVAGIAAWLLLKQPASQEPARAVATATTAYSSPIVITKGGTYTGNWESTDSEVAAVEIQTAEPVTIINSNIRGAGYLIKSWGYGCDIRVLHTNAYGIASTPWVDYRKPRRLLAIDGFKNIVVENCYLENTAGINLAGAYLGNGGPQQSIKIRYNSLKNIDGRVYKDQESVQFVQFNFRNPVQHAEIAWNQVINEPDKSAVEDNISIYNSRGTPESPISIHNNYIQGAFPVPSTLKEYSGGGILCESPDADSTTATAFVEVYENQLVGLGAYCLGIAGGYNINLYRNRAVVAAVFENGTPYGFWTGGIWAKDYYKLKTTFNNSFHDNMLAVVGQTGTWRNELSDTIVARQVNNRIPPGKVTKEMEEQEFERWQQKVLKNKITIGPALKTAN